MKIILNSLQNQMSQVLFNILNDIKFNKVKNSLEIKYIADNTVNIRAFVTDKKKLNDSLVKFNSFHKELVEKILVLANTLYKNIIVIPNFTEHFIEQADNLITRILINHSAYAPYLNEKEEELKKGKCEKCVVVTYRFALSISESNSNAAVLIGAIVTHEYFLEDGDTSMFTEGKQIEFIIVKDKIYSRPST